MTFVASRSRLFYLVILTQSLSFAQSLPLQEIETALRESTPLSNRQQFDDLQAATRYWYESRNPANLPAMDEALNRVLPLALKLAPFVQDFTTWEDAQFVKPYHYAGSILLAKAYTLLYYGRKKEAEESIRLLEEKLPYAMTLHADRSSLWARKALRYHQHAYAFYLAMTTHSLHSFAFPDERDEFDESEQTKALQDQVILRLREGDSAKVDYLLTSIQKATLKSTAGKWMEDIALTSMQPLTTEAHSASAWDEMRGAIQRWQGAFPDSEHARVAEAAFLINHGNFQWRRGKAYSDYRNDIEAALEILGVHQTKTPGWFTLNVKALIAAGRPIDEVMLSAKANLEAFPDHALPLFEACQTLANGDTESQAICGQFLQLLCQQPNKEVAARILKTLARRNLLEGLRERLNPDDVTEVVRVTGEKWNQSLSLRNELADLCVRMGLRDVARSLFVGIEDHWSHELWSERRDVLREVISRKPQVLGTIRPASNAVKFEKWLPETKS